MSTTISVRLPQPMMKDLTHIEKQSHKDKSEIIRRLLAEAIQEWKEKDALEKLRERKISVGKAAELCNLPLWDMIERAHHHNIDWIGYTKEDLEQDMA